VKFFTIMFRNTQTVSGFVNKHADALAPVQAQISLAVQKRWDGSLEEGQVSTDGALSVSLSPPQMEPITPISLTCPAATSST